MVAKLFFPSSVRSLRPLIIMMLSVTSINVSISQVQLKKQTPAIGTRQNLPPCEVQVEMQQSDLLTRKITSTQTSSLAATDATLQQYWLSSKEPRSVKIAHIQNQLNKKKKTPGTVLRVVPPQEPCEDPGGPGGCNVAAPYANNVTVSCPGTTYLYATPNGGNDVVWYTGQHTSGVYDYGSPLVINAMASTSTYWVATYGGPGCESVRIPVTVTVTHPYFEEGGIYITGTSPAKTSANFCPGDSNYPSITLNYAAQQVTYSIYYNGSTTGVLPKSIPNGSSEFTLTWTASELLSLGSPSAVNTYIVKGQKSMCMPVQMHNTVTISAFPPPATYPITGSGTWCGSTALSLGGIGGDTNVNYQLQHAPVATPTVFQNVGIPQTKVTSPPLWNVSVSGKYRVLATNVSCAATATTTFPAVDVTIIPLPVALIEGPSAVCTGSAILTAAPTSGTPEWIKLGSPPTAMGSGTSITVTTAGTYQLKVTDGTCFAVDNHDVVVSSPPSAITAVNGLKIALPGEGNALEVVGSSDATSFKVSVPVADNNGTVPLRKFILSRPTAGIHAIQVTPVKNGCDGAAFSFDFDVKNSLTADTLKLNLTTAKLGYIQLPTHSANNYDGCITQFGPLTLNMRLDLGEDYNFGNGIAFTSTVSTIVSIYREGFPTPEDIPVVFNVNKDAPEQLYLKKVVTNPQQIKFIRVAIGTHPTSHPIVENAVRIWAWVKEENTIGINGVVVTVNPVAVNNTRWEQNFTWNTSCYQGREVPDYIFQLKKVIDTTVVSPPTDWSQALTIHTESSLTALKISMAEGTGKYWWRITPVGNLPGGIANPDNIGTASQPGYFNYIHPEKNANWIYTRTFSEGNRITESVTYANGLSQVSQAQTRIQGSNHVVATQTLQDYLGRNAITSLPVPTGRENFGYINSLLTTGDVSATTYRTRNFDADDKILTPDTSAVFNHYYGGSGNGYNKGVASAEGMPFTRTRFAPDGRVREEANVGAKHSLIGGKTARTYYSKPGEGELVKIFGAEAPSANSLQKVTSIDPNGTTTIAYVTKDNKVVATALESGTSVLDSLPSASATSSRFFEEIKGYERVDDHTIITRKSLLFAKPVKLSVDYQITPALLNELCDANARNAQVGNYPFEDGNLSDQSGRNNHATLGGGMTVANDANNRLSAYTANGTNGYMQIPDTDDNNFGADDFTVSFWVKRGAATVAWDNAAGVGKWSSMTTAGNNEWALYLSSDGADNYPTFFVDNGTTSPYKVKSDIPLATGGSAPWYHIAGVRKGNEIFIYVNGARRATLAIPVNHKINNTSNNIVIGKYLTTFASASYDDIQLYRRALGDDEMASLYSRQAICKTCDYQIDIVLYQEGVNAPIPIVKKKISAGNCVNQVDSVWNPSPVSVSLNGERRYQLVKRISVATDSGFFIRAFEDEIRTKYRNKLEANPALTTIKAHLDNAQLVPLKNYLETNFKDQANNRYVVPVTGDTGCPDYIVLPNFDVCPPADSYDANCKRNGKSFWAFMKKYYAGRDEIPLFRTGTSVEQINYLFYANRHIVQSLYFDSTSFNLMVTNMISENGLACADVWKVWEREVQAYEANIKQVLNVNTGLMDNEGGDYAAAMNNFNGIKQEYNLYESFLQSLDLMLQQGMALSSPPVNDICASRPGPGTTFPYFIQKTVLYGVVGGVTTTSPNALTANPYSLDLTRVYRYLYFHNSSDEMRNALQFYAGKESLGASYQPTIADFGTVSICNKYKLYMQANSGPLGVNEASALETLNDIREECASACDSRVEEFRQELIHSMVNANPSIKIEQLRVYADPMLDANPLTTAIEPKWVGVPDGTVNTSGFNISQCEFGAMLSAVVRNCKNTYCNTVLTPYDTVVQIVRPGLPNVTGKVRVYGTYAQRQKFMKPLTHKFEVSVPMSGSSCPAGGEPWDNFGTSYAGGTPGSITDGFSWGEILTPAIIESTFNQIYTVTNTAASGGGSFPTIINSANSYSTANPTHKILIKFNISGTLPRTIPMPTDITITANHLVIDGSTQPGFNRLNGPAIILSFGAAYELNITQNDATPNTAIFRGLEIRTSSTSNVEGIVRIRATTGNFANVSFIGNVFRNLGTIGRKFFDITSGTNIVWKGNVIGGNYALTSDPLVGTQNTIEFQYGSGFEIGGYQKTESNVFCNFNGFWAYETHYLKIRNNRFLNFTGGFHPTLYSTPSIEFSRNLAVSKSNYAGAIFGAGTSLPLPTITGINNPCFGSASGNAPPNSTVEFYTLSEAVPNQESLLVYMGSTTASSTGAWHIDGLPLVVGKKLGIYAKAPNQTTSRLGKSVTIPAPIENFRNVCFRFTDPRQFVVEVPDSLVNYIFDPVVAPCDTINKNLIVDALREQEEQIINSHVRQAESTYRSQCADPSTIQDKLTVSYKLRVHHYTLFYYDRAGNLIRTVPPEGVDTLGVFNELKIAESRGVIPRHLMVTEYQYNSLGQLVREHSPDASPKPNNLTERPVGTSTESQLDADTYYTSVIYNSLGQIRFSRNAQHKGLPNSPYTYVKYDSLGRMIEGGEASGYDYATLYSKRDEKGRMAFPAGSGRKSVTSTFYAKKYPGSLPAGYIQDNILNQISYSVLDENLDQPGDESATIYSYDVHENVTWLIKDIPGLGEKRGIKYEYDLISGNVNKISYSPGNPDQFFHRYEYDANNRIKAVYTSSDETLWTKDAAYDYYLHGPLKRMELGEDKVQGVDYAYTIRGWLKAINHPVLNKTSDPGLDGSGTSTNGRDVFGMSLGYYTGDYKNKNFAIASANPAVRDVFNGSVSSWTTNLGEWATTTEYPGLVTTPYRFRQFTTYVFTYDDLNRVKKAEFRSGTGFSPTSSYETTYGYSSKISGAGSRASNGNIYEATARSNGGTLIDNLTYKYAVWEDNTRPGTSKYRLLSNRLQQITDAAAASSTFGEDIEPGQEVNNYQYDAIGNLIRDKQKGLRITWSAYGKVLRVDKVDNDDNPLGPYTEFSYDPEGNRIQKKHYDGSTLVKHFYVRDVEGNIMAVYKQSTGAVQLEEIPIYGSERIGVYRKTASLSGAVTAPANGIYVRLLDYRKYELKDHLGSLRAAVTDRKQSTVSGSTISDFRPKIVSLNNYYAFGMDHPERSFLDGDSYRFGFTGFEKDKISEWGNSNYDFGGRIYNPSIGRWFSTDPLEDKFTGWSPYNYTLNNPVAYIDPDGESPISIFAKQALKQGIKKVAKATIKRVIKDRLKNYMSKKWATQFLDDALTAVDVAMGQAWWEYVVEVIPVAGDIYGGAKLTEQGLKIYKLVENIQKRADKIADFLDKRAAFGTKFIKKFGEQAHHIIPFEVLTKNKYVQEAIDAGWDINSVTNGKVLPGGFHANHPAYSKYVDNAVNSWAATFKKKYDRDPDPGEIKKYLEKSLTPRLDKMIDQAKEAWKKGGETSLNSFFKALNN